MVEWLHRRRRIRVSINGLVVLTGEGVQTTASLGGFTRGAEFQLACRPDARPADGDAVVLELVAADVGTTWPLFGGSVSAVQVASEPWSFTVRCVDQLEKLRATNKSGDMNLSGLTDGEAVQAILDYCEIDFDPADIADAGYVLGAEIPVYWHDDASTAGGQVIQELNDLLGMHLMTIGNNRVIRLAVDYAPASGTGSYATYVKGNDLAFAALERARGEADSIQNVWSVRGATIQLNQSCTATPWAFSVAGNAQIGRRVRTAEQSFGSDFIQDEALAEAKVRELMRRFNRIPDDHGATLELDANVHPGTKIGVTDHTYGIDTGAVRYLLVRGVQTNGLSMALELEAGPPGAEGTVTHGVDKVCGDVHTNPDMPGDFDWPAPDFPPLDLGDLEDFDDAFDVADLDFAVDESVLVCTAPTALEDCDAGSLETGQSVTAGDDWVASGTLTLTTNTDRFSLTVDSDDGDYMFRVAGAGFYDPTVGAFLYELLTPGQKARAPGYAPLNEPMEWEVRWTEATKTLSLYAAIAGVCYIDQAVYPLATFAGATLTITESGSPERADETFYDDCGNHPGGGPGPFDPGEWEDLIASGTGWNASGGDNWLFDPHHFVCLEGPRDPGEGYGNTIKRSIATSLFYVEDADPDLRGMCSFTLEFEVLFDYPQERFLIFVRNSPTTFGGSVYADCELWQEHDDSGAPGDIVPTQGKAFARPVKNLNDTDFAALWDAPLTDLDFSEPIFGTLEHDRPNHTMTYTLTDGTTTRVAVATELNTSGAPTMIPDEPYYVWMSSEVEAESGLQHYATDGHWLLTALRLRVDE